MVYIGKSVNSFLIRYRGGKWWKTTDNKILKEEAKKYGHENFSVLILEENIPKQDLKKKEELYICYYDSLHPKGYNKTSYSSDSTIEISDDTRIKMSEARKKYFESHDGPNLGKKFSEEICKKISESKKGIKMSDELKAKFSDGRRKAQNHVGYGSSKSRGFSHSEESLSKISKARIGKGKNGHKVYQVNPDNNEIIKEFSSIDEASREIGCSIDNIYNAIHHKKNQQTAFGFKWRYVDESYEMRPANYKILQICKDTDIVLAEFSSASLAAKSIGIKGKANIISVCAGRRFTCGGYKWKFKHK